MQVAGRVGACDLGVGVPDADDADGQLHRVLPPGKDRLDAGADLGLGGVGPFRATPSAPETAKAAMPSRSSVAMRVGATSLTLPRFIVTSGFMAVPIPKPSFLDQCKALGALGGERRWRDGNGLLYTWDSFHGEIEVYNRRGRHLGAIHAVTGQKVKDAVKGRQIDV